MHDPRHRSRDRKATAPWPRGNVNRFANTSGVRPAYPPPTSAVAPQQSRQLGKVDGNPACLVISENICLQRVGVVGYAVDLHERLTVGVAHDIAARNLFDTLFF